MSDRTAGFRSARPDLADRPELPERIGLAYEPVSCLSSKEGRSVWLVRRRADGAPFLLKRALWGGEDLAEEFRLLALLQPLLGPAVPAPVDCFEADGVSYLLRSYLPGETLAARRAREGGCSPALCREVGRQLCALLAVLHGLDPPVVHRDIKPENIILGDDGSVKLIDYGIARRYEPDKSGDTRFMGTEGTAAPEQYGFAQTDERTDLYALGMTLVWVLTGTYDRDALAGADVSPRLRRVLRKCTAFAPEQRYQSAAALSAALAGKLRPGRIPRLLVGCAALCAALVLGGLAYTRWWLPSRPVEFESVCLEAAVRAELDRPQGEVTRGDLEEVTRLALIGSEPFDRSRVYKCLLHSYLDEDSRHDSAPGDVSDLSLLAQMPNLTELYLCEQAITDLSPLEGLPLTTLALAGNQIEDVSPLSSLPTLKTLYIGDNPVADYTPLAGLTELRSLNLDGNYDGANIVTAPIGFLAGMPLELLSVCGMEPEDGDWSALAQLPRLRELLTWHLPAEAVPWVAANGRLSTLALYRCQTEDLTGLAGMDQLNCLSVNEGLPSLAGVEALTGLEEFNATYCAFSDLAPLEGLPRLNILNLYGTVIEDYAPLADLRGLSELTVHASAAPLVEAQCPGHPFRVSTTEF